MNFPDTFTLAALALGYIIFGLEAIAVKAHPKAISVMGKWMIGIGGFNIVLLVIRAYLA